MNEDMFHSISDRIPDGYDWSVQYNDIYVSSLENYKMQFYEQQMAKIIGDRRKYFYFLIMKFTDLKTAMAKPKLFNLRTFILPFFTRTSQ